MYRRSVYYILEKRILDKRRFIQILSGPRQTGKTTLADQLLSSLPFPSHYATADDPIPKDRVWIEQQWETARLKSGGQTGLLILDEIQKIIHWSETIKRLWDEDTKNKRELHVVLLGSSPLLIQKGLIESLTGRFEVIPVLHWNFIEMREAFGWDEEMYVYFGGYPGSAQLVSEEQRWRSYILDSLIETSISRDILLITRIDKPALLRQLFELSCLYSGQILSYQKMIGQLSDAGNTTTLAHYLEMLGKAGFVTGLSKFAGEQIRRRASSPKLMVLNTALKSVLSGLSFKSARQDHQFWGRLYESSVGAYLSNSSRIHGYNLYYWLDRNREVDFVLQKGNSIIAIEVKSGKKSYKLPGISAFVNHFNVTKSLVIGSSGLSLEELSSLNLDELFTK